MTVRDTHIVCETVCHGVSARDSAFHAQSRVLQDPDRHWYRPAGELAFTRKITSQVYTTLCINIGVTYGDSSYNQDWGIALIYFKSMLTEGEWVLFYLVVMFGSWIPY